MADAEKMAEFESRLENIEHTVLVTAGAMHQMKEDINRLKNEFEVFQKCMNEEIKDTNNYIDSQIMVNISSFSNVYSEAIDDLYNHICRVSDELKRHFYPSIAIFSKRKEKEDESDIS